MTANTPKTKKAKGRVFQNFCAERIREYLPCHPDDVRPVLMSGSGMDLQLSPAFRERFPIAVECKRVESLNAWRAFSQARANTPEGMHPAVFAKSNREVPLVIIEMDLFLKMWRWIDRFRRGLDADL